MTQKPSLRSIACDLAKIIASHEGTTPNKKMKDGWRLAKEGYTPETYMDEFEKNVSAKRKEDKKEVEKNETSVKEDEKPESKETNSLSYFRVSYKGTKGQSDTAIVGASSKEEAVLKFNDPSPGGPKNTILKVSEPKKIPVGWMIAFENGKGVANAKLLKEVDLEADTEMTVSLKSKEHTLKVSDMLAANEAKRSRVLSTK